MLCIPHPRILVHPDIKKNSFTWIESNRFADVISITLDQFSCTFSGVTLADKFCRKTHPEERTK